MIEAGDGPDERLCSSRCVILCSPPRRKMDGARLAAGNLITATLMKHRSLRRRGSDIKCSDHYRPAAGDGRKERERRIPT